jgi:hypothetical protein
MFIASSCPHERQVFTAALDHDPDLRLDRPGPLVIIDTGRVPAEPDRRLGARGLRAAPSPVGVEHGDRHVRVFDGHLAAAVVSYPQLSIHARAGVIRPILLTPAAAKAYSVHHRLPSGPAVMSCDAADGVGSGCWTISPHRTVSGPACPAAAGPVVDSSGATIRRSASCRPLGATVGPRPGSVIYPCCPAISSRFVGVRRPS